MPELHFKGKEFVYNHHLSVPYCPLVPNAKKSIGDADLSGNLIIHGDNLVALKSLMPYYAGKVDCIFIDPPYNTGNESWSYNDNVNNPIMREWLKSNPVNKDDMLRHDKWLCMMYPRLKLLHELLAAHGSFWMTLDDNEIHRARLLMDEIFGEQNFLGSVAWEKADSPRMDVEFFSSRIDHVLVYAKSIEDVTFNRLNKDQIPEHYDQTDGGGRKYYLKPLRAMGGQGESREARPNLYFGINAPDGTKVFPKLQDGSDGAWRWSQEKVKSEKERIEWRRGRSGNWTPYFRIYGDTLEGRPPETIFFNSEVGSSRTSKAEIKELFPEGSPFDTPKPIGLLKRIVEIATEPGAIVLDSFAGSGTTAHAVLAVNKVDKGHRTFVMIESEDYADATTAERVRRVIKGVKSAKSPEVKNGTGGNFTYCTLGNPIDMDKLLTGENLPKFETLGAWLFHTATGEALKPKVVDQAKWFLGETAGFFVWLIYKPDLDFLKSRDAALTLELAERIAKMKSTKGTDKRHLVFAPAKYVPNKMLLPLGVEHVPLPFALYRVEKS